MASWSWQQKVAKTASKSFLLSSFYSKSHHFFAVLMYAMYSPHPLRSRHFKFRQKYQQYNLSSRLYLSVSYDYEYALEYRPNSCYGNFSQISCAESNLCRFFPSVNTVKHWRWNFVWKCSTAWRLQLLIAKLARVWWSSTFRCLIWLAFNSKCDSESCYVRHDEDTSHSQRPEAATRGALWKKELLEISQNSQENVCVPVSFLKKFLASGLQLYWKRDSGTGIFMWILQNF